jgi:tetratricopeptide (TPR) repeat protein
MVRTHGLELKFAVMRYLSIIIFVSLLAGACKSDKEKNTPGAKELPGYVNDLAERVNKHPDSTGLRFLLIEAYDSLGMFQEAIAQTDSIIKGDSTNNAVWMRKGMLQESAKDTLGAIRSYKRSIAIYPAVDAQLSLANLFAERKNDTALLLVMNVARMMPDNLTLANCDFIAGVYHSRKGHVKMAEELFNRCISENIGLMEAYIEKGLLYFDQKKFDEALKIFQTATSVNGKYADAFYYQARCYEAMGKTQEAVSLYKQALSIDPGLKEAAAALNRLGAQVG